MMKLVYASALLVNSVLVLACAPQPQLPQLVQPESADFAEQFDPQTLQEIRVTAKTVALARPTDSDVICREVTPTGSHISKQRCDRRSALRRQREEAQKWLRTDGLDGSVSGVYSVPTR